MIPSDVFYRAFDDGLASVGPLPGLQRGRGKASKYVLTTPAGPIDFWFKVNPKASAIPHQPGEFWPVIETAGLRRDAQDDGTISWYQYADAPKVEAFRAQQERVHANLAAQTVFEHAIWCDQRDISLRTMRGFVDLGFRPAWPHTALYYLDAGDAAAWGALIGGQLPAWIACFSAQPETLESHMWRLHWSALSS